MPITALAAGIYTANAAQAASVVLVAELIGRRWVYCCLERSNLVGPIADPISGPAQAAYPSGPIFGPEG